MMGNSMKLDVTMGQESDMEGISHVVSTLYIDWCISLEVLGVSRVSNMCP